MDSEPPRIYSDKLGKYVSIARDAEELAWVRSTRPMDSVYTPVEILLLDHLESEETGVIGEDGVEPDLPLLPIVDTAKALFRGWVYSTENSAGEVMTRGDARARLEDRKA